MTILRAAHQEASSARNEDQIVIALEVSAKAFDLTSEMELAAAEVGARYGVKPDLSDKDQLFGFLINNVGYSGVSAVEAYFTGGYGDAHAVTSAIQRTGYLGSQKKILEFAAGYGRVSRHLYKIIPDNILVSSDIHKDACDHIRDKLGLTATLSSTDPDDLRIDDSFDFIFVLSLFSHLPESTFGRWLGRLYGLLSPGGSLLFTTHGEAALRHNPEYFGLNYDTVKGFGYRPESDQQDLKSENYGTAVVSIPFVYEQLKQFAPSAELTSFRAFAWFGLQDEWLIRRPATG